MNTPDLKDEWLSFIENKQFPCVAAKAALTRQQQHIFTAGHLACPRDDKAILDFIYSFVDTFRNSDSLFHSVVILFTQPEIHSEEMYAQLFWQRLQALSDMDAMIHNYDPRVSADPESEQFSFSLKSEAFYVIGLHPASSREGRKFKYPAIVFNPHVQFEKLRQAGQYEKMKQIVRKRDVALTGSINPMLEDFGKSSEAFQYTGQHITDNAWKCPLNIQHGEGYNQTA